MESWVDIKKGKLCFKVPYQAYKDVFEGNGFEIMENNLSAKPTFSFAKEPAPVRVENTAETKKTIKEKTDATKRPNSGKNIK